jgi:hypothetical protein
MQSRYLRGRRLYSRLMFRSIPGTSMRLGTGTAPVSGSWGMGVPNSGAMLRAPMDTKQIQAVAAEI